MNERSMQFRVGMLVFATLLITGILALSFRELPPLLEGHYTVHVRFTAAPGVAPDTPVRKNGLPIGRVTDVQFTDNDRAVLVTAEIYANRQLYRNDICLISSSLLGGDATLDFVGNLQAREPGTPIVNGETIEGRSPEGLTQAVANLQQGLGDTMKSVGQASREMSSTMQRISRLLDANEARLTQAIERADEALKTMQTTLTHVNNVIGDPKAQEQLKDTITQLPQVLKETRQTIDVVGQGMNSLARNLQNVEGITKPLGARGSELVDRIDQSVAKIDSVADELLKFSTALNRPDSSLGQLVSSPDLYQHLNRAARNVDELTRELRPILDDARVFSDKIARHPEVLGVRGALQRSPGIK
ncbi:MAG: MlaD family protein, partial [Thermoguttaceae bacterium]